jgi:hypothetical protein
MVVAPTVFAGMAWGRIGAAEPSYLPGALETYLADYLAYRGSLLGFERLANGCLVVGVLTLGVLGLVRHAAAGPAARTPAAGIGAAAYGAGAVVFAAAQLAYLAAAERILAVHATPGFDRAALATMLDVADRTDDYVENLGLLLLASGLLALGRQVRPRRQRIADSGLALMITVVVITNLLRSPLNDPALVLAGGLAAPVWRALTVRYVRDLQRRTPPGRPAEREPAHPGQPDPHD